MDNIIESNEAAEMDANGVYIIEQPTVGQQITSVAIGTLVPLAVMGIGFGLIAVGSVAVEKIGDAVRARKARKAEKKNTIVITSDED